MRYLRYSIFLSTILIATGIFLPYVELGLGGFSFGKKSGMPLYNAVSNYTFLERVADGSEATMAERVASGLLAKLGKSPTRFGSKVREAQGTLKDIKAAKEQARLDTVGTVLRTSGIVFLFLLSVIAYLVMQSLSQVRVHRKRTIWTAALMGLVGAMSIALYFVVREALHIANQELGAVALTQGSGAYMMLVGGITGLAASLATLKVEKPTPPAPLPAAPIA